MNENLNIEIPKGLKIDIPVHLINRNRVINDSLLSWRYIFAPVLIKFN